jgi:ATP-dependent RNA helicase DHX29
LLPISSHEKEIVDLIKKEQVVVISGKTGCGKSTKVPQFILKSEPLAKIAVCQPRRVAATSLAIRVSQ